MKSFKYNFETNWKLEADIDNVWGLISSFTYGDWWPGVRADLVYESGDPNKIGDKYNYVFRTKLPYQLAFIAEVVRREAPHAMEIRAHGELEGRGVWELKQEGRITYIRYTWQVNTTKKWMDRLAPILRPVFVWNHDQVMDAGAKGLADALRVKLVSC